MNLAVNIKVVNECAYEARLAFSRNSYLRAILALLLFTLIASCQATPSATSQPPAIEGRLILRSDDNRYWQVALQGGDLSTQDITGEPFTLPSQGINPFFSPGGRFEVTAYGDDWQLRDTADGTHRALVDLDTLGALSRPAFDRGCEAMWSPDGQQVAVIANQGLYVAGVDGGARLVLQRRVKLYTEDTSSGAVANNQASLETRITCPVWLTPEDVLVTQFTGALPESFMGQETMFGFAGQYRHEQLDTTSVLHITSSGVEIRDMPVL